MARIDLESESGTYPVMIQPGLLEDLPRLLLQHAPAARYAVISDDRVAGLYGDATAARCRDAGLDAELFTFPEGEVSKTRKSWSILTDRLLAARFGRDAAVVAVGGGVTGDLAGFVAATFLRGIPVVQVPTSLVAMIDASVGGKTGVDAKAGKNLVGAFHPPKLVAVDPLTIDTLPVGERAQGLAEAVKHGAILDRDYFDQLVEQAPALMHGRPESILEAVRRSVELKAAVVAADERETGRREILNFGHTYGHALEAAAEYRFGHGSAVGAGMILEARLGEGLGVTEPGTSDRLKVALSRFGLGTLDLGPVSRAQVMGFLGADKKARSGAVRFVMLECVGRVAGGGAWSREVPEDLIKGALDTAWPPKS
jgi:3-dehydroquinate synthase